MQNKTNQPSGTSIKTLKAAFFFFLVLSIGFLILHHWISSAVAFVAAVDCGRRWYQKAHQTK